MLGNLNLTDREKAGYSLGLFSPEMAPFIDKISQQFNPHKTLVQQDLGDRTKTMGFDPASGEYLNAVYEQMGLNPKEMEITRREGIKEKGANYRTNVMAAQRELGNAADWYIDTDDTGKRVRVNKLTGEVRPLGYSAPPKTSDDPRTKYIISGYDKDIADLRRQYQTSVDDNEKAMLGEQIAALNTERRQFIDANGGQSPLGQGLNMPTPPPVS
ncbi:hypothetical protein FACS1894187_25500 [Synergistales bacterium]|nr:hypothetical protein FACS1894187_25500 [Synergistales bacterium]